MRVRGSPIQFASVMIEDRQQLFVVDVPQGSARLVFPEETEVRQQLAQPHVPRQLAEFGQKG
jgi:hypothetical protein